MKLLYRESSQETKNRMIKVAKSPMISQNRNNDEKRDIKTKILSKINHDYCEIVNSGNAAIMVAMNATEGPIIIPDQRSLAWF
ncbi:hypothetical protein MBCUT_07170 [Methanobrevibacter cuticularis]|uniref:Uncharacterized protein n=1 Tax=Methanobrevibacter cuticularis TaxID=47311 RepID=A0A166EEJ8_9EURY|nr:hypothetical protein [Methanobrevibacter cuticularis]KZX16563.1 hypothetical protein MBCUT_07170 [Methanobrevibacter cuticularis]